jgi:tRNA G26 N,N-dimethylase Trm1
MDTSDSMIQFDDKGVCDFCNDYYQNILPLWKSQQQDENLIHNVSEQIRKARKDKEYDCIIGMSGGLDSSYLCYVA